MKTRLLFILLIILFTTKVEMFAQCVSIELGVKWERETHVFHDDSIICTPKLLITYRNNSDKDYYFLKVSNSRFGYPELMWGTMLQYPFEEYRNPDYLKRAKSHGNYENEHYFVRLGGYHPSFLTVWEVEKDTITRERVIDTINDNLADIYRYLCQKNYGGSCDSIRGYKVEFSESDVTGDKMPDIVRNSFVFLKSGEVYTDTFNLVGFQLVKGHFTFFIGYDHLKGYVHTESVWDNDRERVIYPEVSLPAEVEGYTLYSGSFYSNKIVMEF